MHITFYTLYYHSHEWPHLETKILNFLKMATWKVFEQYHQVDSFPVGLQIQYDGKLLFLDKRQIVCEQLYFRLFK